jgi:hypothetical protein
MSLYSELCENSKQLPQLEALHATLDHFGVTDKESIAEALLSFRIIKDHNLSYDKNDPLLKGLLAMDEHFNQSLAGSTN